MYVTVQPKRDSEKKLEGEWYENRIKRGLDE
jgi:hypothetical protein